jgi:oligopeptide ABC transporter, ATP-binding protein AppF
VSRQQNPLIQVKDLKKYYPVKTGIIPHVTDYVKAVDGVSFSIYEGEILGLVGESGCGKTTIGKLLTGLEKPTEGAILYRGMDILDWTAKEQKKYRTKIQMIFQDPYSSLNPRKHIYEILAAPMLYHGISDRQTVEKDVKELLEMVGMPQSALGRYPHEFSGGQRQRIGIARALSLKPEFIVCDEPVSALDVSVQAQILNLLKSLQNELQLTLLFIGHGLGAVHYVSDRIAVMQNGRIVELGDAREVFHHPQQEYTKMLLNSILEPKAYSEDRDS